MPDSPPSACCGRRSLDAGQPNLRPAPSSDWSIAQGLLGCPMVLPVSIHGYGILCRHSQLSLTHARTGSSPMAGSADPSRTCRWHTTHRLGVLRKRRDFMKCKTSLSDRQRSIWISNPAASSSTLRSLFYDRPSTGGANRSIAGGGHARHGHCRRPRQRPDRRWHGWPVSVAPVSAVQPTMLPASRK